MDPTIKINQRIDVAAIFRKSTTTPAYPAKMNYHNREITFTKLGLHHPTQKGHRTIHVFDMTDGANDYRLEFDAQHLTWTLISIIPGSQYEHP